MAVRSQRSALRIVIIDDNSHFLKATRNVLRGEGADVVGTTSTIREALQLAVELRLDVILVDVHLGEESGFHLAERLSAADAASVVLISAYPEAELARRHPAAARLAGGGAVQAAMPPELGELERRLWQVSEELTCVFEELRELAHGFTPRFCRRGAWSRRSER